MADFTGKQISRSLDLAVVMAVVSSIAVGILVAIYLLVTTGWPLFRDLNHLLGGISFGVAVVFAPIFANIFGIVLSAIVMPIALGIWPRLKFYSLLPAACFAINPFMWTAIASTASGQDGYYVQAVTGVFTTLSTASILSAAICGLFYRRMEQEP